MSTLIFHIPSQLYCCPKSDLRPHGSFYRKSDSKTVLRWRCRICRKTISQATDTPCFGQNKRRINDILRKLLVSGVSQRRAALILHINLKTVARKLRFLAAQARLNHLEYLQKFESRNISYLQFDEMEAHEHTKLKPLSIAIAVEPENRILIGIQVSEMPAKGHLAKKSVLKYGKRIDGRRKAAQILFGSLEPYVSSDLVLKSDQNPKYLSWIRETFRTWTHETVKGRRGCIVGQGELKKIGFDPLFSLNHTFGMIRANVNRLFRKTWCTTKKKERLQDHLDLYMDFHNRVLIR